MLINCQEIRWSIYDFGRDWLIVLSLFHESWTGLEWILNESWIYLEWEKQWFCVGYSGRVLLKSFLSQIGPLLSLQLQLWRTSGFTLGMFYCTSTSSIKGFISSAILLCFWIDKDSLDLLSSHVLLTTTCNKLEVAMPFALKAFALFSLLLVSFRNQVLLDNTLNDNRESIKEQHDFLTDTKYITVALLDVGQN